MQNTFNNKQIQTQSISIESITYFRFRLIVNEVLGGQDEPSLFIVDRHETFFVLRPLHHQTLFDDVTVIYFIFVGHHCVSKTNIQ